MRFIFILLITAIASYFSLLIMPWWIPMVLSFCVILILPTTTLKAFLATGLGAGIATCALLLPKDLANEHILSQKMAVLFFHTPNYPLLIFANVLIASITAGLGSWTASTLKKALRSPKLQQEEFVSEQSPS